MLLRRYRYFQVTVGALIISSTIYVLLFHFQVIAVNAEGVSEPLECVDAFIPENPFGTPGAPGKPEQIGKSKFQFEISPSPLSQLLF